MTLKITILGCGNSAGVPSIGNHWGNCDPAEPKNRRLRPSIAVQSATTTLVVDTGPDFREQMNQENIQMLDAVLYTHPHGDHICGIDDLRILRMRHKKLIDVYGDRATLGEMEERFNYMFIERTALYPQALVPHVIEPSQFGQTISVGDIHFIPYEQDHGTCKTLGFRFGNLAYSTDMVNLDDRAIAILQGIETWIVDAAGYKMEKNMVHITLRQLYDLNKRVGAIQIYLTHMSPAMDYQTLCKELPAGYAPAYDGLVLNAIY
jgi:phosphoribosyl 1,2-cyclic phosphate phosphodiesterase